MKKQNKRIYVKDFKINKDNKIIIYLFLKKIKVNIFYKLNFVFITFENIIFEHP